jgi:hypothetical protein
VAAATGVDLCLGGHLHLGYSGNAAAYHAGLPRAMIVAQAGTAISNRRRGEPNGYNVVRLNGDRLELEARVVAGQATTPVRTTTFARTEDGWEVVG